MLETFTVKRGPARGGADHEAAATHVARAPDQVADSQFAQVHILPFKAIQWRRYQ